MIATNAAFHSAIAEAGRNAYFTGLPSIAFSMRGGASCGSTTNPMRIACRSVLLMSMRTLSPSSRARQRAPPIAWQRSTPSRSCSRYRGFARGGKLDITFGSAANFFFVDNNMQML